MKTIIDAVNYFKGEYTYDSNFLYFDENGFFGANKNYSVDENNYYICSREEFNQCVKEMMTNFNTSPTYSEYSGMLKVATELVEKHKQPVFTKEMQDAGKLPEVGMQCNFETTFFATVTSNTPNKGTCEILAYHGDKVWINIIDFDCVINTKVIDFSPIDNRTDKEKAIDEMYKEMNRRFNLPKIDDDYMCATDTQIGIEFLVEYMEIHGVKWVGKE